MKTTDFARILSSFLLDELPMVRNQSGNTISFYRDTYVKLLTYFRDQLGVNPEKLNVSRSCLFLIKRQTKSRWDI